MEASVSSADLALVTSPSLANISRLFQHVQSPQVRGARCLQQSKHSMHACHRLADRSCARAVQKRCPFCTMHYMQWVDCTISREDIEFCKNSDGSDVLLGEGARWVEI